MTQPVRVPDRVTTEEDLAWWFAKADTVQWTWAKTYAETAPHWYVVDGRTLGMTTADYLRAGRVIRTFGVPGKFYNSTNIYLLSPDGRFKYWAMWSNPPQESDATLINRASTDQTYGTQDAPDTVAAAPAFYDAYAADYDRRWSTPDDLVENRDLRTLLRATFGAYAPTTLDVGAGTGLLLDLGITSPALYEGVDPSQGMLNELVLKHPKCKALYPAPLSDLHRQLDHRQWELITALFAVASYLTPRDIEWMYEHATHTAMWMTYAGDYLPEYYVPGTPTYEQVFAATRKQNLAVQTLMARWHARHLTIGQFDVWVVHKS